MRDKVVCESLQEFLQQVKRPPLHVSKSRHIHFSSDNGYESETFTLTESFENAMHLAEIGWPEGLAKIRQVVGEVKMGTAPLQETLMPAFAEAGDEVDVGRFTSGEPEAMVEFKPQFVPAVGRVLRVVCHVGARVNVSTEDMFNRGAAAFAISDLLEQSGLRVEVWMVIASQHEPFTTERWVLLKRPDEQIEPDRLAFFLAHPSTHRRLFFRAMEQCEDFWDRYGDGHGRSVDALVSSDDIYIGPLTGEFNAMAFINSTLAKYVEPQPA